MFGITRNNRPDFGHSCCSGKSWVSAVLPLGKMSEEQNGELLLPCSFHPVPWFENTAGITGNNRITGGRYE